MSWETEPVETVELDNGVKIEVLYDTIAESPREWSNTGTILYTSHRYLLGDEKKTNDEITAIYNDPENIACKVYAYIHGNTALSLTPFSCQWDSGCSGIIYATKDKVRKDFSVTEITTEIREQVIKNFEQELEVFEAFINGQVFLYRTMDAEGNELDSCGGYFSTESAIEAAKENYKPVPVEGAGI